MYVGFNVKNPLLLPHFNETWLYPGHCRKIFKHQTSWKFVQWEPSCSTRTEGWTDRQSDMPQLTVPFHNFATAPKISVHSEPLPSSTSSVLGPDFFFFFDLTNCRSYATNSDEGRRTRGCCRARFQRATHHSPGRTKQEFRNESRFSRDGDTLGGVSELRNGWQVFAKPALYDTLSLSYVTQPLISFLSAEVYTETLLRSRSFGFTNVRIHKLRVLPYIYSLLPLLNFAHPVTYIYIYR